MAKCVDCGCEFDIDEAREFIDSECDEEGTYDNTFDEPVCKDCAWDVIGAALGTWKELAGLMPDD